MMSRKIKMYLCLLGHRNSPISGELPAASELLFGRGPRRILSQRELELKNSICAMLQKRQLE